MKLLLDQNLSPRLAESLIDLFPAIQTPPFWASRRRTKFAVETISIGDVDCRAATFVSPPPLMPPARDLMLVTRNFPPRRRSVRAHPQQS
jgi:hypothetical protein